MKTLVTWTDQGRVLEAGLVTTPYEQGACYVMRYKEYHDEQREIPTDEHGLDIDPYDEWSTLFCSRLDGRVVGTMRLILCTRGTLLTHGYNSTTGEMVGSPSVFSGKPFEMPTVNPVTGQPVLLEETVEGSRYVAHQIDLSNGQRYLHSVALLKAGMRHCRKAGIKQVIGALHAHHFAALRSIGWQIHELMPREDGEPHTYHGMPYRVVFFPVQERDEDDYDDIHTTPVPTPRRNSKSC